jgi:hypothetical protein
MLRYLLSCRVLLVYFNLACANNMDIIVQQQRTPIVIRSNVIFLCPKSIFMLISTKPAIVINKYIICAASLVYFARK